MSEPETKKESTNIPAKEKGQKDKSQRQPQQQQNKNKEKQGNSVNSTSEQKQSDKSHNTNQQQQQQQHRNKERQGGSSAAATSSDQKQPQNLSQQKGASKQQQANPGKSASITTAAIPTHHLAVFDHLPKKSSFTNVSSIEGDRSLNHSTIKLGILFRNGSIREDDDRVSALIIAFCAIIRDYSTPPNKSLSWDLDKHIRLQVQHLVDCRQHSMGMGNLIKSIRYEISQIAPDTKESDAKNKLIQHLYHFNEERIVFARESIVRHCQSLIREGDVILTYSSSAVVNNVLLSAAKTCSFRVIVVDSRPLCDGIRTLRVLSPTISCVYTSLSGAAAAMREATKVIIGASALLANGAVVGVAGTAMVACLAKSRRVPVIVAAESYKFCEKVQLDAIVFNELGSVAEMVSRPTTTSIPGTEEDKSSPSNASASTEPNFIPQTNSAYRGSLDLEDPLLTNSPTLPFQVFNLRYDLTPIHSVSVVATEAGLIPPTSVPVLIKELRVDEHSSATIA